MQVICKLWFLQQIKQVLYADFDMRTSVDFSVFAVRYFILPDFAL